MKLRTTWAAGAALLLSGTLLPQAVAAAPSPLAAAPSALASTASPGDGSFATRSDDLPDAMHERRTEEKRTAVDMVATGQAKVELRGKPGSKNRAVEINPDDWVEYGTSQTAQLFSILVQFGDGADPRYPDATPGPRANQIPEPGRNDNSTYWVPKFDRTHYLDMFFNGLPDQKDESFRQVYKEMSSGRFDLKGDVSDWVTLPNNSASYGEEDNSQADMTRYIQDTANAWYDSQIAAGKTKEQIVEYLKSFDVWDRYDVDGDGVTNEPDGYIDHFQAIHAGEGEEAGAPTSTIWSHRWAANIAGEGVDGPANFPKSGGVKIGDTDIWIRDYTTEPENGGLGVFAHEFGHDLGLPDYYDTEAPASAENGTAFWTLMSDGSWLNHGKDNIGTTPNHMGANEKMFLGWLDHATVKSGRSGTVDLGPSYHATTRPQAVVVTLPDGKQDIEVGPPASGAKYFYSGRGDGLDNTVTSPAFKVPTGGKLTAKVNYQIETDWDYAYVESSVDGGTKWESLPSSLSTDTDPNGGNLGNGITGSSDGWVDLSADLSALAGKQAQIRFRYVTDGATNELGFSVDDIAVGDALSTGAEDGDPAWTQDGFLTVNDGHVTQTYTHYYLAEYRKYAGYDATLKTGPYNFGWAVSRPKRVQHFPYQDGLLVWYVNSLYSDNNTSQHPGHGSALPVDSHPVPQRWSDGRLTRNRFQTYDATFGRQVTDRLQLNREVLVKGVTKTSVLTLKRRRGVAVFDDTKPNRYYAKANPTNSVIVAGSGTRIVVKGIIKATGAMRLAIRAGKKTTVR